MPTITAFLGLWFLVAIPSVAFACITGQCHTEQTTGEVVHAPVAEHECRTCHEAEDAQAEQHQKNPEAFSDFVLASGEEGVVCLDCHDDVKQGTNLHDPVKEDDCLACHTPHAGDTDNLLTVPSQPELCFSCHDAFAGEEHVHSPVEDGECTGCHSPHGSGEEHLLSAAVPSLCFSCHDDMEELLQEQTVHPPVEESCLDCHQPHASPNAGLLIAPSADLCLDCHRDATPELVETITNARHAHPPVADGECLECHRPHATDGSALLRAQGLTLCGQCHEETSTRISGAEHQHPPVEEEDCAGCHAIHGADQPKLLTAAYSTAFYNQYSTKAYALCFRCHDPALVESERAANEETNFRNGDHNLHWVHVVKRKKKGRGCHVCHDPHGSGQPFMLHTRVPFRNRRFRLKIKFTETATGGTCVVGCHKPQTYSRSPVE